MNINWPLLASFGAAVFLAYGKGYRDGLRWAHKKLDELRKRL